MTNGTQEENKKNKKKNTAATAEVSIYLKILKKNIYIIFWLALPVPTSNPYSIPGIPLIHRPHLSNVKQTAACKMGRRGLTRGAGRGAGTVPRGVRLARGRAGSETGIVVSINQDTTIPITTTEAYYQVPGYIIRSYPNWNQLAPTAWPNIWSYSCHFLLRNHRLLFVCVKLLTSHFSVDTYDIIALLVSVWPSWIAAYAIYTPIYPSRNHSNQPPFFFSSWSDFSASYTQDVHPVIMMRTYTTRP